MSFADIMAKARSDQNPLVIIQAIPYMSLLGIDYQRDDDQFVYRLKASQGNIGNTSIPALHGGAIGGFLECAGVVELIMTMRTLKMPKIVNFSIDYLRTGLLLDTYAQCRVVREGNKFANLHIEAWQQKPTNLVAQARANVLIE